jgi:hypothetical protein
MDKTYTIFKDSMGLFPTEHRIIYTVRNPKHQQYKFADVSFSFDPNKKKLKRLDFFVDDKLLFINLQLGTGVASPVWLFQRKGSYQKITESELSLILTISFDILNEYPNLPKSFKETFEILPMQAKVYRKFFDENISKKEKKLLFKVLHEKNNLIRNVEYRYKKLVESHENKTGGINKN